MKPQMLLVPLALVAAGAADATHPLIQTFQLPNGLSVSLLERHDRPLLRAELRVAWPTGFELPPATLMALQRLLSRPEAGPYMGDAFSRGLEDAGARFNFKADYRAFSWQVVAPSVEGEQALDLLAHRAMHPRLEPAPLEALRRELRRGPAEANLEGRALDRFFGLLGAPAPLLGAPEEALDLLTLESVITAHRTLVQPAHAHLVLHGDLSLDQARALALLHFGAWGSPGEKAAPTVPLLKPLYQAVGVREPGRPLELWVALRVDPAEGMTALQLELAGAALQRAWHRPPAPFREVEVVANGGSGLLLVRLRAGATTSSAEGAKGIQAELDRLRREGLPESIWRMVHAEALAKHRAEILHPDQWVAHLARRDAPLAEPSQGTFQALNALFKISLREQSLAFLILGADAKARVELGTTVLGQIFWLER